MIILGCFGGNTIQGNIQIRSTAPSKKSGLPSLYVCVFCRVGHSKTKTRKTNPPKKKHIVEGCGEDVCIGYVGVFLSSSPKGGHRHSEFWVGEPWVPHVLSNFLESLDELVTLFRFMG